MPGSEPRDLQTLLYAILNPISFIHIVQYIHTVSSTLMYLFCHESNGKVRGGL